MHMCIEITSVYQMTLLVTTDFYILFLVHNMPAYITVATYILKLYYIGEKLLVILYKCIFI